MNKAFPYGLRGRFQLGSAAAANKKFFKEAVGLIFDKMLEETKKRKKGKATLLTKLDELKKKKSQFIETVVKSAEEAMAKLLERSQGRKKNLKGRGADEKTINKFREYKPYLGLINEGMACAQAYHTCQR